MESNPLLTLYKYYGMRISFHELNLIVLSQMSLSEEIFITNKDIREISLSMFIDNINIDDYVVHNFTIPGNTICNFDISYFNNREHIYILFNIHDNCVIKDYEGKILYNKDMDN